MVLSSGERNLKSWSESLAGIQAGLLCPSGHSSIRNHAGNSFRLPMGLRLSEVIERD